MAEKLTGYDLSRQWFEMVWENPEITANDTSLYLWLCEIWNRLGHPPKFQITAKECMQGMSANTYNTFKKSFDKLKEMGCLNLIKQSTNQYQCNVIALLKFDKAPSKALNKANIKARNKAPETFINPKPLTLNPEPLKEKVIPDKQEFSDDEILNKKIYKECIGLYNDFCLKKLNVPAKIDGAQGNAMKSIITYLKSIPAVKNGSHSVQDSFKFILDNWGLLDEFLKAKIKLTEINSNFINILTLIKTPKSNVKGKSGYNTPEELAAASAKIDWNG